MNFLKIYLIISVLSVLQMLPAQILELHIEQISAAKGQLCIAVFADEAGFKAEKTVWETKCPKTLVVNGNFELRIPVKPGTYGLSVLDDENCNGRMDYRLFGIPSEGFGFSVYYQKGLCRPVFDDFSFSIGVNEIKRIRVVMKYF